MFVVGPHGERYVQIREYWQGTVGFRNNGSTLDVLIRSESDVDWRVARGSEQLRSRVFVEHPFTERGLFLPLETAVLVRNVRHHKKTGAHVDLNTYDELFVSESNREVSVERNPEILGVVTFVRHNVFQKYSLMAEDLSQPSTLSE